MNKRERKKAIEDLKQAHEEYLTTVSTYSSPTDRKPILEESIRSFTKNLCAAEDGSMSDEELVVLTKRIKEASEDSKFPKGGCSPSCIQEMLEAQDLVIGTALKSKLPLSAFLAIMKMTNSMMTETMASMLLMANGKDKHWEVKERVHHYLSNTTGWFKQLVKIIEAGDVHVIEQHTSDPSKIKQFLN